MCDCEDCLGRTPYASLIATTVMCVGVGLFCGTGFYALDITLNGIFEGLFKFHVSWLLNIQIIFTIFGIVMGLFAIMLLLFGFLSTGTTRQNVYASIRCIVGGRVSAIFFMSLTYLLNAAWMAITSFCAMPIIVYVMLRSICANEIEHRDYWFLDNYCLNLSRFGVYTNMSNGGSGLNSLCDEIDLSQFCQHVVDAGPMFCFAFAGSCLIVLGLVVYLSSMSSNYERIRHTRDLNEFRSAVDLEMSKVGPATSRTVVA